MTIKTIYHCNNCHCESTTRENYFQVQLLFKPVSAEYVSGTGQLMWHLCKECALRFGVAPRRISEPPKIPSLEEFLQLHIAQEVESQLEVALDARG